MFLYKKLQSISNLNLQDPIRPRKGSSHTENAEGHKVAGKEKKTRQNPAETKDKKDKMGAQKGESLSEKNTERWQRQKKAKRKRKAECPHPL